MAQSLDSSGLEMILRKTLISTKAQCLTADPLSSSAFHGESVVDTAESSHVDDSSQVIVEGLGITFTLTRLLVNIPLQNSDGETRRFVVLGGTWENTSGHTLLTLSSDSVKLIDSEGYQHSDRFNFAEFHTYLDSMTQTISMLDLSPPELELAGHAKTKGWIYFGDLPAGVRPYRLITSFPRFKDHRTSGLTAGEDRFEFVFSEFDEVPIEIGSIPVWREWW